MKKIDELLTEHPFFVDLDDDYVALLAGCGVNVHFHPGDVIFKDGEPADKFYVIRKGKAALDIYVPQHGPITIETATEGDVLGFSWLFPPHRWLFDARAVTELSAVALDGACLRGKCDADHRLGYQLMRRFASLITDRLQATRMRLLDMYGNPTQESAT